MAHFAKLTSDNIVEQIVTVNNNELLDENGIEQEQKGIDFLKNIYNEPNAKWIQTSYNKNFRKRYAKIGDIYDLNKDAFLPSKPYPSSIFDETIWEWVAPIPYPKTKSMVNGVEVEDIYVWDESQLNYVKFIP